MEWSNTNERIALSRSEQTDAIQFSNVMVKYRFNEKSPKWSDISKIVVLTATAVCGFGLTLVQSLKYYKQLNFNWI